VSRSRLVETVTTFSDARSIVQITKVRYISKSNVKVMRHRKCVKVAVGCVVETLLRKFPHSDNILRCKVGRADHKDQIQNLL